MLKKTVEDSEKSFWIAFYDMVEYQHTNWHILLENTRCGEVSMSMSVSKILDDHHDW